MVMGLSYSKFFKFLDDNDGNGKMGHFPYQICTKEDVAISTDNQNDYWCTIMRYFVNFTF